MRSFCPGTDSTRHQALMRWRLLGAWVIGGIAALAIGSVPSLGIEEDRDRSEPDRVIPHNQSKPPGPALNPEQAIERMRVPEGFAVEIVAAEPDLVNPVAFTFDERGRIWVAESLEYPRMSAGLGQDRIKVLEDTDGDGRVDRTTIFADGLNIPSGLAVGRGGVWVANSPDILLLQDLDGDLKADRREVIVTGFGRYDTHELPNSLTWGPDGWLYGWNGVFNRSVVTHQGKIHDFTCALFRIHPETRRFELFAEGTSNPWGVAFNPEGSAFASACVIDHLWHLSESGYYHRQGGPYPPFTWKLESIVDHRYFKAAYCGLTYFDSDAYPPEYRDLLYMGNIHQNAINVDRLERRGATYYATKALEFLEADDVWFMPVSQKTGPDGCLYVLDWYDRYHCYQDARRDPEGIDRLKGRLYRVRYRETPRRHGFDLASESDETLIELLGSANIYDRQTAQRLLVERQIADASEACRERLEALVLDNDVPDKPRRHALWTLISAGPLEEAFHLRLLGHEDRVLRAWAVRAAGHHLDRLSASIGEAVARLADDEEASVAVEVAIAAGKAAEKTLEVSESGSTIPSTLGDPISLLLKVLANHVDDPVVPRLVWGNLHPLIGADPVGFLARLRRAPEPLVAGTDIFLSRIVDRALAAPEATEAVTDLVAVLWDRPDDRSAPLRRTLDELARRIQNGELGGPLQERLATTLGARLEADRVNNGSMSGREGLLLAATWGQPRAIEATSAIVRDDQADPWFRLSALASVIHAEGARRLDLADVLLAEPTDRLDLDIQAEVLALLGRLDAPEVASVVLNRYPSMSEELKPKAIVLLTQRVDWALALLAAIDAGRHPREILNLNQVRALQDSANDRVRTLVQKHWGRVREDRDPQRDQVIARMNDLLATHAGDAQAGAQAFQKVCAQCHQFQGRGQEVGPDLTDVGRGGRDLLLSNVFDPNLVIGSAYQATLVATLDGRVLNGIVVEDSPQRIGLKIEGGQVVRIPRDEVEAVRVSDVSLMPEGLENQLSPQEWADLFEYLGADGNGDGND